MKVLIPLNDSSIAIVVTRNNVRTVSVMSGGKGKGIGKGMMGEIRGYTCDGSYGDEIILTKYVFGPREREYSVFFVLKWVRIFHKA